MNSTKTIGPDQFVKDAWMTLDPTCQPASKRHGNSRSQAIAVQVLRFSNDKYTVRDSNGYTYRAYASELS